MHDPSFFNILIYGKFKRWRGPVNDSRLILNQQVPVLLVQCIVVDPNTLNLDLDPGLLSILKKIIKNNFRENNFRLKTIFS